MFYSPFLLTSIRHFTLKDKDIFLLFLLMTHCCIYCVKPVCSAYRGFKTVYTLGFVKQRTYTFVRSCLIFRTCGVIRE